MTQGDLVDYVQLYPSARRAPPPKSEPMRLWEWVTSFSKFHVLEPHRGTNRVHQPPVWGKSQTRGATPPQSRSNTPRNPFGRGVLFESQNLSSSHSVQDAGSE
eukprot:2420973-Amphidinium_carterae.2